MFFFRFFAVAFFLISILSCSEEEGTSQPTACFSYPENAVTRNPVLFDATCSKGARQFLWKFGDGTTSNAKNGTHEYLNPGRFNVTLVVTNGSLKDSVTNEVIVRTSEEKLSNSVKNCLPAYGIFSMSSFSGDSVIFSYLTDRRVNDMKFFANTRSYRPAQRVQFEHDETGELKGVTIFLVNSWTPYKESALARWTLEYKGNLPYRMNCLAAGSESPIDSLSVSYFIHDEQQRLIEIRRFSPYSRTEQLGVRYQYGSDGNVSKVTYNLKRQDETQETIYLARENLVFDNTQTFYAGVPDLKKFFEYFYQTPPNTNNLISCHLYSDYSFLTKEWIFYNNDLGLILTYRLKPNDISLIESYNYDNYWLKILSEVTFRNVKYNCN